MAEEHRSSGVEKSLKDEALDSLKALRPGAVEAGSPPSPVQALLSGISAGIIALILYKFSTRQLSILQTISDNFSVCQIMITIRTIVNGLCYLATLVLGINSVGLFLGSARAQFLISSSQNSKNRDDNDDIMRTDSGAKGQSLDDKQ